MQKKLFSELGLSPESLKAVAKMGFEEASPIQSEAIPALLTGRDVVGQSQTGSGKTAAYALPAIERVDPELRAPQVLVLCPTRELVVQVAEEIAKLKYYKPRVRELPIYGGASYERQFRGLQAGAHIIIGTPGRTIDHLERKSLNLGSIKMVVLDECDRMLDMGFREDMELILKKCPPERQTIFFSATLPKPIQNLIQRYARDPQLIQIASLTMEAPMIDQIYYEVGRSSKLELLCRLIDLEDISYGIIFCGTKMMVDELVEHLTARGYAADKLHGDMTQAMRERTMRRFREKKAEFLVATDVAARGLDVENVEVVFNYDLPQDPEDYVHRIGRTGRAGKSGRAVTFVAGREVHKIQQILRYTKGRIRREVVPTLDQVEKKRSVSLFDTLKETLESGNYQRHDEAVDRLLDSGHTVSDIASALLSLMAGEKRAAERIPEDNPSAAASRSPREGGGRGESRREYPRYVSRGEERPRARGESPEEAPAAPARPKRARPEKVEGEIARESHEPQMARLEFNQGREHGVTAGHVVGVIAGVTRLSKETIGAIKLLPRETLVDVAEEHVALVLKKLNGIQFKGGKLAVRRANEAVTG